jgi:hypothetical protein
MNSTQTFSDVLTRHEASTYLKVCPTTLDRLDIPRIKVRRRVLIKKSSLDKWIGKDISRGRSHRERC